MAGGNDRQIYIIRACKGFDRLLKLAVLRVDCRTTLKQAIKITANVVNIFARRTAPVALAA